MRFTVRRLMVATAAVALTIAAVQMWQRWTFCRSEAVRWATIAALQRAQAEAIRTNSVSPPAEIDREVALINQHRKRSELQHQRFAHAASHPWLPVPADLPLP